MTGANRLLIGIAWPMVIVIGWLRFRQVDGVARVAARPRAGRAPRGDRLRVHDPVPGRDLAASTSRSSSACSCSTSGAWRASPPRSRTSSARPSSSARCAPGPRRAFTAVMAIVAAVAILLVAKPFATSLVATGHRDGHRRVPARPVARAARVRGAGVRRRRAVRVARCRDRGPGHARQLQDQPVDAARGDAAARLLVRRSGRRRRCRSTSASRTRSCSRPRSRCSRSRCCSTSGCRCRGRGAVRAVHRPDDLPRDTRGASRSCTSCSRRSWCS